MLTTSLRKINFTAHVTSSIGWLGAVSCFLVLSVAAIGTSNSEIARGAYLAMYVIGQYVLVPLSLAALLTGLVQSLGTPWGLFRHYWIVVKLTLTIGATLLLALHQLNVVARAASRVSEAAAGAFPDVGPLGHQLVHDASLAVIALLVMTVLAVYKPWGRTQYGQRKLQEQHDARIRTPVYPLGAPPNSHVNADRQGMPLSLKIFIAAAAGMVLLFGLLQHIGGHVH